MWGSLDAWRGSCDVGHERTLVVGTNYAKPGRPSNDRQLRNGSLQPRSSPFNLASFTASNDRALLQGGYLNVLDHGPCSHVALSSRAFIPT